MSSAVIIQFVCFMGIIGSAEFGRDASDESVNNKSLPISSKIGNANLVLNRIKVEATESDTVKSEQSFEDGGNYNGFIQKVKIEPKYDDGENEEEKVTQKYAVGMKVPKTEWEQQVSCVKQMDYGSDQQSDFEDQVESESDQHSDYEEQMGNESDQHSDFSFLSDGWSRSDKCTIINKFIEMRKEYKNRSDYKQQDCGRIELKIANALGISRKKIYQWRRELGQLKKPIVPKRETKMALIKKFDKMKKGIPRKKRTKMENQIAKELGTSRHLIFKWKRELGLGTNISNEKRHQIIKTFDNIKEELSATFNAKINRELEGKIAEKCGVKAKTIRAWKLKFGLPVTYRGNPYYTDEEKLEMVRKFDEMKRRNHGVSNVKIAQLLNIDTYAIIRWKDKFGIGRKRNSA